MLLTAVPFFVVGATWRLPDTYHSAGSGRGTATLKFYDDRDILAADERAPLRRVLIRGCATLFTSESWREPAESFGAVSGRGGSGVPNGWWRRRGCAGRSGRVEDRRRWRRGALGCRLGTAAGSPGSRHAGGVGDRQPGQPSGTGDWRPRASEDRVHQAAGPAHARDRVLGVIAELLG